MPKQRVFEPLLCILLLLFIAVIMRSSYEGVFYLNEGFLGGRLSDLPIILRFGFHIGYVLAGAVLYFYFFRKIGGLQLLDRTSIHLIATSMSSNFVEKVLFGNVFDFIPIAFTEYYCNLADLCFLLGSIALILHLGTTFYSQIKNNDKRQSIFASYRIQCRLFLAVSFVFFSFFLSVIFLLSLIHSDVSSFALVIGAYYFLFESILFCILIHFTNRILGPVDAFIRYALSNDRTRVFSLRSNDEFNQLELVAKELSELKKNLVSDV
jgi:lipoprotein signal peptidase